MNREIFFSSFCSNRSTAHLQLTQRNTDDEKRPTVQINAAAISQQHSSYRSTVAELVTVEESDTLNSSVVCQKVCRDTAKSSTMTACFAVLQSTISALFEGYWSTVNEVFLYHYPSDPTSQHHHHHHHLSLNHEGRWDTTDDFATCFLHFPLFSTALWDLANSRPVHSSMLSSQHGSQQLIPVNCDVISKVCCLAQQNTHHPPCCAPSDTLNHSVNYCQYMPTLLYTVWLFVILIVYQHT